MLSELDSAVDNVIVPDEPTDESNDHDRRHSRVATGGDQAPRPSLSLSQKSRTNEENCLNRQSHILHRERTVTRQMISTRAWLRRWVIRDYLCERVVLGLTFEL